MKHKEQLVQSTPITCKGNIPLPRFVTNSFLSLSIQPLHLTCTSHLVDRLFTNGDFYPCWRYRGLHCDFSPGSRKTLSRRQSSIGGNLTR